MDSNEKKQDYSEKKIPVPPWWKYFAIAVTFTIIGIVFGWVLHTDNTNDCTIRCEEITEPATMQDNTNMIRDYRAGREEPENDDEEGQVVNYVKTENIVVNSVDLLKLIKKIRESDEADSIVLIPAAYNAQAAERYVAAHPGTQNIRGATTVLFGIETFPALPQDGQPVVTTTPTIQLYRVSTSICPPPMQCAQIQ